MQYDPHFFNWHCTTSAFIEYPRAWAIENLAESICDFNSILAESAKAINKLKIKIRYPPAITTFQSFVIQVFKEAEIQITKNLLSTRVTFGSKKGQVRIQNNINFSKLNKNHLMWRTAHIVSIGL